MWGESETEAKLLALVPLIFQNAVFSIQSETHYRTENLQNDFFLDHLQPGVRKKFRRPHNLEFYSVTCKPPQFLI